MLADVAGYFIPGAAELPGTYVSIQPVRVLDTRTAAGSTYSPVSAGRIITVKMVGTGVPPEFYVRVMVRDVAGNIGKAETTSPIIVDLTRPTARIVDVEIAPGSGPQ